MSRPELERLLRESYYELLHVTKSAGDIERQSGVLRAQAAELVLRIYLVLGGLGKSSATSESVTP